jgi:hypothetical protein
MRERMKGEGRDRVSVWSAGETAAFARQWRSSSEPANVWRLAAQSEGTVVGRPRMLSGQSRPLAGSAGSERPRDGVGRQAARCRPSAISKYKQT